MTDLLATLMAWVNATQIPAQLHGMDAHGLFTNGYFLVPFILLVGYMIFKRSVDGLVILGLCVGLWVFSGTPYVQGLYVNGEVQMDKMLPVVGVGVVAMGLLIYIFFIRSD